MCIETLDLSSLESIEFLDSKGQGPVSELVMKSSEI